MEVLNNEINKFGQRFKGMNPVVQKFFTTKMLDYVCIFKVLEEKRSSKRNYNPRWCSSLNFKLRCAHYIRDPGHILKEIK